MDGGRSRDRLIPIMRCDHTADGPHARGMSGVHGLWIAGACRCHLTICSHRMTLIRLRIERSAFDWSRSAGRNGRWWNEEIYAGMSRGGVTWKKTIRSARTDHIALDDPSVRCRGLYDVLAISSRHISVSSRPAITWLRWMANQPHRFGCSSACNSAD